MGMRICTVLSGDRRKIFKTNIYLDGITAEEAINGIDSFMLEQSDENNQVNLSACPDHYVLRPFGENELRLSKLLVILHFQFNFYCFW